MLLLGVLLAAIVAGLVACGSQTDSADSTTSSGDAKSVASGDIAGQVGTAIAAAEARVTVSLLEQAFQPTVPVQRLSQDTPILPARGMSLYQAYVTVENRGDKPIRSTRTTSGARSAASLSPLSQPNRVRRLAA